MLKGQALLHLLKIIDPLILPIKINKKQQKIIDKILKNNDEIFVPVQCGYDNYYISNQGRLWSEILRRFLKGHKDGKGFKLTLINNNGNSFFKLHPIIKNRSLFANPA